MTICCTILTGLRPDLLARTIAASAGVLTQCDHVTVVHSANDLETRRVLTGCGIRFDLLGKDEAECTDQGAAYFLDNGQGTTACALAAKASGCDLWLHCEDDWLLVPELVAALPDWLPIACDIASNPAIGQVRLREETHLGQLVTLPDGLHGDGSGASNINWVDGRPVPWRVMPDAPFMVSNCHLTFNPMIMRTALIGTGIPEKPGEPIAGVFPAETERHAMARFYAANLLVAQLRPGVYRHLGEGRHSGQH